MDEVNEIEENCNKFLFKFVLQNAEKLQNFENFKQLLPIGKQKNQNVHPENAY